MLVTALVIYLGWLLRTARREPSAVASYVDDVPTEPSRTPVVVDLLFIIAGLILLAGGANALVNAATDVAETLGLSQLVIGLTVVAIGTSLPEIATSVLAAFRGERELAVGNAIGSNLFNLLAVLGGTALISGVPVAVARGAQTIDIPVMIAASVACLPLFATGYLLSRWEGAVFVIYYLAYVAWLILDGIDHGLRDSFAWAMVGFVLPLTAITLLVIAVREWRRRSGRI
jgi:cation:H+ antiporter